MPRGTAVARHRSRRVDTRSDAAADVRVHAAARRTVTLLMSGEGGGRCREKGRFRALHISSETRSVRGSVGRGEWADRGGRYRRDSQMFTARRAAAAPCPRASNRFPAEARRICSGRGAQVLLRRLPSLPPSEYRPEFRTTEGTLRRSEKEMQSVPH